MEIKTPADLLFTFSNQDLKNLYEFSAPAVGHADCFSAVEKASFSELSHIVCSKGAMKRFRQKVSAEFWIEIMAFLLGGERPQLAEGLALIRPHCDFLRWFCQRAYSEGALARLRDRRVSCVGVSREDGDAEMYACVNEPGRLGEMIFFQKLSSPLLLTCFAYLSEVARLSRVIIKGERETLLAGLAVCRPSDCGLIKKSITPEFVLPLLAYLVYEERVDYGRAALFLRHDCQKIKWLLGRELTRISRERLAELRRKTTLIDRAVRHRHLGSAVVSRRAWKSFLRKADRKAFAEFSAREVFTSAFVQAEVRLETIGPENNKWFACNREAGVKFVVVRGQDGGLVIENVLCLLPAERRKVRENHPFKT